MDRRKGRGKMGRIILATGGARCGKSRFAEEYAKACGGAVAYIATAQVKDEEMAFRVGMHQERRPAEWDTYEAPFDAHKAVREAGKTHDVILFDCVTLYLSNLLCSMDEEELEVQDAIYQLAGQATNDLIEAARSVDGTVIFVTNEVGGGIVPEHRLARVYRDMAGLANQRLAAAAAEVYLVVAGIAVDLRKLGEGVRRAGTQ